MEKRFELSRTIVEGSGLSISDDLEFAIRRVLDENQGQAYQAREIQKMIEALFRPDSALGEVDQAIVRLVSRGRILAKEIRGIMYYTALGNE